MVGGEAHNSVSVGIGSIDGESLDKFVSHEYTL